MDMCPECNTVLEEYSLKYDEMTEGQQTDYDAGFRDKRCPNCGFEIEQDRA